MSINNQNNQATSIVAVQKKKIILRHEYTVIMALAIIFVFFSILSPNFLGPLILPGILLIGAELGILALGETMVIISGEIDLSIASVYGWAAVLATVLSNLGFPYPLSLATLRLLPSLILCSLFIPSSRWWFSDRALPG